MNDKRNDNCPPDERLYPSESIWQSWCRVAHRQLIPVSNLRVIIRLVIVNEASKRVIEETLQNSAYTRQDKNYIEYTDVDEGFFGLLGSTNGASSMRMLIDHKEALEYRTVKRVVVVGERDPGKKDVPSRTLIPDSGAAVYVGVSSACDLTFED